MLETWVYLDSILRLNCWSDKRVSFYISCCRYIISKVSYLNNSTNLNCVHFHSSMSSIYYLPRVLLIMNWTLGLNPSYRRSLTPKIDEHSSFYVNLHILLDDSRQFDLHNVSSVLWLQCRSFFELSVQTLFQSSISFYKGKCWVFLFKPLFVKIPSLSETNEVPNVFNYLSLFNSFMSHPVNPSCNYSYSSTFLSLSLYPLFTKNIRTGKILFLIRS